jgi:hypothetical protein
VVTDMSADAEEIERINQAGIEVIVAGVDAVAARAAESGKARNADVRMPA